MGRGTTSSAKFNANKGENNKRNGYHDVSQEQSDNEGEIGEEPMGVEAEARNMGKGAEANNEARNCNANVMTLNIKESHEKSNAAHESTNEEMISGGESHDSEWDSIGEDSDDKSLVEIGEIARILTSQDYKIAEQEKTIDLLKTKISALQKDLDRKVKEVAQDFKKKTEDDIIEDVANMQFENITLTETLKLAGMEILKLNEDREWLKETSRMHELEDSELMKERVTIEF